MQMMQADRVPGLLPDDEYFSEGFSAYAVNFAESCEVDKLQQETKTDDREDVYRSILKGKVCIKDIGSLLLPRADTDPQRWVAISGRSGYGSGTLGQYLSYLWYIGGQLKIGNASLADTSLLGSLALKSARQLRGRYDLVLRVPCRMMGDSSVWTSAGEQTPSGYLAHLIQLSLGGISTARQRDLLLALTTHDDRTLVILDGFDEVRFLYGADAVVTAVIDRVMASGNGIIITKAGTMPSCWQQCGIHRITESIELIGFGREDARQYVKAYFAGRPNRAVSEAILAELDKNENMLRLASVPINCAALCVTWDADSAGMMACATGTLGSYALLIHRIAVWLTLRYGLIFKVPPSERRACTAMTTQSAHSIYRRCHDETIGLAAVAFHALRSDSRLEQTDISDAILTQYFPNEEMLRRFVATHGIVRPWCINEAVTDARLSYSTTIRFAHQCYYEYYAALYIVETLSAHSSDVTSAHIADIYNALADTAPHLVRVRLIAVGLSVLPEYIRSADSVCRTIIDTNRPFTTSDLRIGVHEYHRHLRRHADLIMEAQKTYVWMRWTCHDKSYLLPPLTAVVIESCSDYLLWNSLARVGAILSHWDYSVPSPDDQHKQAKSITETAAISSSRRSLGLPIFPPPDLCQWLMQLSSFSGAVQRFCEDAARGASAEIRLAAVNALGAAAVSDSSTISLMRDLLCQEDVRLRLSAATTLAYAGFIDEASVSVLRTALWEADDSIKQQAAEALGSVRNWDAASAEALRSALNNISWSIRGTAVEALGRIDNANANVVAILESALRDERSEIRLAGIGVVGRIGARDAITVSSLRRSLSDDDWHIATAAAETLARIGFSDSQCLSIVHSHAKASDAYNRVVACEVLGKMTATDAESLSLLRAALNDPEWAVRYAAAGSLSILSPESVGSPDRIAIYSLFRVATQSSEWAIRLAAVEALGCCGRHADSHLLLCEATSDTNKHVRAAAANSIGKVRCVSIALTAALCTLLSDEYWNVRRAASEALGKILAQDGDTLLLLVERLHDDDIRVGRAASLALKYVSYHITDAIVMKKLLESAHSAFVTADLEMTHSIHVALLRVLPRTYLRLFNDFQEYLNVENVKKMFVMSIWLHCSNISADIASNPVTVRLNGSIHQFTCSDTETALFFDQLQKLESDIIHSKCGDMACAYKTAYVNDTPALLLLNLSANPYSIK